MLNDPNELPQLLGDAVPHLVEFLEKNGYPNKVFWVTRSDVAFDAQDNVLVRARGESSLRRAELLYEEGVRRGLGIALRAVCATEKTTFASIFIPSDEIDAEHALMARGLKLSCPTRRRAATVADNPLNLLRWVLLRVRNRKRMKLLTECFFG